VATLAELMSGINASSGASPYVQFPKPSPISQFKSIEFRSTKPSSKNGFHVHCQNVNRSIMQRQEVGKYEFMKVLYLKF